MTTVAPSRLALRCHGLVGGTSFHHRLNGRSGCLSFGLARRLALVGGAALSILLQSQASPAAELAPLELAWWAPRQCPQHFDVMAQIQKLVGGAREREREQSHPLSARGMIEPSKGQFDLTLWIQDGKRIGIRSIESTSCQSLGDAAAVVLSSLIRQRRELGRELSNEELSGSSMPGVPPGSNAQPSSEGTTEPSSPSSSPEATPRNADATNPGTANSLLPTKPETTAQSAEPPQAANNPRNRDEQTQDAIPETASAKTRSERRWRILLAAPMTHLEFGTLPKVSGGAGVALGVTFDAWQAFASVAFYAGQTSHISSYPDFRGYDLEFRNHRSIAGWLCRSWETKPLRLAPCVVLARSTFDVSVSASRIDPVSGAGGSWWSPGVGAKAALSLTREIALACWAVGRFGIHRPEFLVDDYGPRRQSLHHVAAVDFDASLGFDWFF
jgi:hypothetical protein